MILSVSFSGTEFNELPYKFEAGTPHISGAVGLARALDYLSELGWESIRGHESDLLAYGTEKLSAIEGLRIYGTSSSKGSILSFVLEGVHPHDVGTILDQKGIAVRTGHHCTQPIMEHFGIPATTRASLGIYNTRQELDTLAAALVEVKEMMT
jgi:cysteine desulfurase/selenocysteine lyase